MNVQDAMTKDVLVCRPTDTVVTIADLMYRENRGCLPVVDVDGRVLGMVTDRDVCLALVQHRRPLSTHAGDIMSRRVYSCLPEDDTQHAVRMMREARVRRLPVIDSAGQLKGVVSIDDLAHVSGKAPRELSPEEVVNTLDAVSQAAPLATQVTK